MRIAIVGGGIGGLTVALALREFGFEAEVYEQAPQLLDVGAAIALWPNALRVLDRLGLTNKILEHSGEIRHIYWLDRRGSLGKCISIPTSVALHRADLQSTLLHAFDTNRIHLDHNLINYEQHDGKVIATFTNGRSIETDFLIGADGIHSDVRAQFLGDGEPIYRGYTVWRGISSVHPDRIPPTAAIEIHDRGKRFGIGPVGGGRTGWWAASNSTTQQHSSNENPQDELLRLFKYWYRPAVQLIETTPAHSILTTAACDRKASRTWGEKRMTLLGDAIHPTTPNLGQGGCLAIEDAMVLARCFETYGPTEMALRKYEGCRYKRTAAITKYSRYYGTMGQSENLLIGLSKKFLFPRIPETAIQRLVRTVFDYDATTTTV